MQYFKYIQTNTKLFDQVRLLLKYLFENKNIDKIFHDCRSDSIALHYLLEICP